MRKPSVIRIDHAVTRTALDLRACCGSSPVHARDAALDVTRAGYREDCQHHVCSCCGGCTSCGTCGCGGCGGHQAQRVPVIHIPAFENDDAGRLVFVWSAAFHALPPGLYAAVLTKCRQPLASFLIDLGEREHVIADAENTRGATACDPLNGYAASCGIPPGCECAPEPFIYVPPYDVPVRGA